ncbi:MAG TPA: AAA family ATPase, partial [Vicinamibacterales bacterium]|nr:AAA family ATPase [Vicinamibacterales bacterium]
MGENGSLDEAGFLESLTQINKGKPGEADPRVRRPLSDLFPPAPLERPPSPLRGTARGPALPLPRAQSVVEPEPPSDLAGYETFYGFHDRPFGPAPDLRFLYHSAAHDAASESLLTAISRRDAVTILTGVAGIGKTTLCSAVIDQLDRRTMTSVIRDPVLTLDDLLERVLVDFGVTREDSRAKGGRHDALTAALQSFSASLAPLQAAAVIVIDEAHRLAGDVIDHLDILTSGGGSALILILVGEPALLGLLKRPGVRALDERIAARVTLGPLAGDEIPGYIAHRLRSAGDAARVEFDDEAIDVIDALSAGVPAVVNAVCDRALVRGFESSAGAIDANLIEQAARDLHLVRRDKRGALRVAMTALVYVGLMLLGAAGAAWIFWDKVQELLRR